MAKNPLSTVKDLEGLREELRLQLHLAGAEARDQWHELEQRWNDLKARMRDVGVGESSRLDQLGSALSGVADDLRRGYERIRDRIASAGSTDG